MKLIMLEHYRDARVYLEQGAAVEVKEALGAWLLEHRKAYLVEDEPVKQSPALPAIEPEIVEEKPAPEITHTKRGRK